MLPVTMTPSITAASRIVWLVPAPYNASIQLSCFPADWRPHDWFNLRRTGSAFFLLFSTFPAGRVWEKRCPSCHRLDRWKRCFRLTEMTASHLPPPTTVVVGRPRRGRSVVVCSLSAPETSAAGHVWDGSWVERSLLTPHPVGCLLNTSPNDLWVIVSPERIG